MAETREAEERRLADLASYGVVDTPSERAFDTLTEVAAVLLDVPIALVSLVTEDRQWFKSRFGLDVAETARDISFCTHVVGDDRALVVPDANLDPRFRDNPLVTSNPNIRFYAGMPLRTPEGHVLGSLCAIDRRPRNIDAERLRLLDQLAKQVMDQLEFRRQRIEVERERNYLRGLLTAMSEGVVVQQSSGEITESNPAAEALLGLTADQLRGRTSLDPRWRTVHLDGSPFPGTEHPAMVALATGEPIRDHDMGVHRPDGSLVWLAVNSEPLFLDASPTPTAAITTFRDVTRERNASRAMLADRELLRHVLGNLPATRVLIFDADLQIGQRFGQAVAALDDEATTVAGCFPTELQPELSQQASRCLQGQPTQERIRIGNWHLDVAMVPLPSSQARGVCVVVDVTGAQRLQHQLAQQQRLVTTGTLAAGVGHELNNPLTFILANLEYALEEIQDLGGASPSYRLVELAEVIREAFTGASRMRRVVRGLRAFAREESDPEPVLINNAIELSINMAMHELRQVATLVRDHRDVPLVLADESRLSQVLVNLLVNAAQAFESRDPSLNRVVVRSGAGGDGFVDIQVSDNGPGMSEEVLAQIFDPFFTTKPVGVGTGLGLAISHNIIHSLGGELIVSSTPGTGTTFTVRLPAVKGEASESSSPLPVPARGRVLVIDDEPGVQRSFQRLLQRRFEVVTTGDPRYALQLLESGARFDVIFCDLMMPHMNGLELYRQVRALDVETAEAIVFVTGGAPSTDLRRSMEALNNEVLEKPVSAEQLRRTARAHVDRPSTS